MAPFTSSAREMVFEEDRRTAMMFSTGAGGGRPEIGLLPLARVAMDVATAVLPPYRSRFSKHPFPQPQLLAILCLMRYADGTFREAEVRLREPSEWRALLRLWSGPAPPPCSDSCVDCRTRIQKRLCGESMLRKQMRGHFAQIPHQPAPRKHFQRVVRDVDLPPVKTLAR